MSTSIFSALWKPIEAGVHKIRLNPGNITDRAQVREVIQACKAKKIPIRVGVNEGSIVERKDKQKRLKELGGVFSDNKHGHFLAIMITKLEEYLDIFREEDFHDIVISAKSIDPLLVIDAYKEISKRFDYPLHLGVTHAGPKETGTIRSRRAAGPSAGQRHRRHDPHQLRQRSGLRSGGRPRTALRPRPAHAHRRGADRLPDLRPDPGRSLQARAGRPQASSPKEIRCRSRSR